MNIAQIAVVRIPKAKLLAALGLPAKTLIVGAHCEDGDPTQVDNVWLTVAHDKLPEVEMGKQTPEISPLFEVVKADVGGERVDVVKLVEWSHVDVIGDLSSK